MVCILFLLFPECLYERSFSLVSLSKENLTILVIHPEVGCEVDAECKRAPSRNLLILCVKAVIIFNKLCKFALKLRNCATEALLNISHDIILLLGHVADEVLDLALIVRPELKICAEHLCLVDQVILSHDLLDALSHWQDNLSVGIE